MAIRRVVVTGLGIISPVGNTVDSAWDSILAGKGGMKLITSFDTTNLSVKFAGLVSDFTVSDYVKPKDARRMDPFIHYGMAAGVEAVRDSGIEVTDENAHRMGVAIGSGIGGISTIEKNYALYVASGPRKVSPFFVPGTISNMISGNLSIMFGMKGPSYAIVTACSTGTHNIGDAGRMIAHGDVDVMVAGGAEAASSPLGMSGFAAARALSTRNDDIETASRPWDKDRDGFVLGDGAGVLVLEEYEHAKARGAKIYAEIAGFGMSGDAYHMTSPPKDGEGARRCMENAMRDAGLNADQIDYINAHGTSTPLGDLAETMAVKGALGASAKTVAVSSTKSMTGHLLGAAGGIEAIFSCLAIRDQVAPPTINVFNQDPECDLDIVPNTAREMKIDVVMSNSFGFGGTNGTVIFKKV